LDEIDSVVYEEMSFKVKVFAIIMQRTKVHLIDMSKTMKNPLALKHSLKENDMVTRPPGPI
jgi:hypothetical protein